MQARRAVNVNFFMRKMVLVRKICAKIHLNWEIGKEIVKKLYFCTKICMQMKENVLKAALFDLDGVVFDTDP